MSAENLTVDSIKSTSDKDVEQLVMDSVEKKMFKSGWDFKKILPNLPTGSRALYLTWVVEAEVENGGFNQFYWNGYGWLFDDAVKAFEYFGAADHAAVLQEAHRIRSKEKLLIGLLKLIGTLRAFSLSYKLSKLEPVDERFYDLNGKLGPLRIAKIRATPEQFTT